VFIRFGRSDFSKPTLTMLANLASIGGRKAKTDRSTLSDFFNQLLVAHE
jgi:hypothetical protein